MNVDKDKEEFQHDWYGILGCEVGTSIEEIAKSARKLALKYHPDKSKEPEAPAKFLLIQKAKEILLDEAKKKIIDDHHESVKKREQYEAERNKGMDERRKRFRDALEKNVQNEMKKAKDPNEVLAQEIKKGSKIIDNIRKQNQSMMEEAMEEMKRNMEKKNAEYANYTKVLVEEYGLKETQVKLKWKRSISHDDTSLRALLSPYGSLEDIDISSSKGTSAIITFTSSSGAKAAIEALTTSEDYRISFANEEGQRSKPAIFTHTYTSSTSLNTALQEEIQRAKEYQVGKESISRGAFSDLSNILHPNVGPDDDNFEFKKVSKSDFVEYEKGVLAFLRQPSLQNQGVS
jgi:curved DNA-binding protein CbpA